MQYPFGHGLSYTTFRQTMSDLDASGDTADFTVTVTNTSAPPAWRTIMTAAEMIVALLVLGSGICLSKNTGRKPRNKTPNGRLLDNAGRTDVRGGDCERR